jgi:prepilin-type N-terminal cleavage/methylation domain-containing protein
VLRRRAYTLIELIVAVSIVAVLVAVLMPVFGQAKQAAQASVCMSNFKQVSFSSMLYMSDYDDHFALSRYRTSSTATSADDRTWVQLVLPYNREFRLFRCPSDYTQRPDSQAVFDGDLVPGDTYTRYYTASKHTNVGYNYLYLSPLIRSHSSISPLSRSLVEVYDPTSMLVFGDSVHKVTPDGLPEGGGNYLIVPPCRYALVGGMMRDTFRLRNVPDSAFFIDAIKWEPMEPGTPRAVVTMSGGLWPWHSEKLTAIFADGHARRIGVAQAADGCRVRTDWGGYVYDLAKYVWDLD